MQAPPENSLTEQQRVLFDGLDALQQDDIRDKILTRNELNNIQINNDLRNEVRGQYDGNAILNLDEINQAFTSAKTEIINEYNIDINRILEGDLPELRRAPGRGLNGLLVTRAVDILRRRHQVAGKLRKSSKKRSAARRRSSKYRKARKSTKKNQTRGGRRKYSLN